MQKGVEIKYIILFAILIALTGFTFESQLDGNTQISATKAAVTVTASNINLNK